MKSLAIPLCLLCSFYLLPPGLAEQPSGALGQLQEPPPKWHSRLSHPYYAKEVPPVNLSNTPRLDSLMRAGRIYLSLADAIALALENNLDIEIQRYGARLAEADLARAHAGGAIRGTTTAVQQGATSATGRSTSAVAALTGGIDVSGGAASALTSGGIPSLDPVLSGSYQWGHFTAPQVNSFIVGSNAIVSTTRNSSLTVQKGFLPGARASLGLTNRYNLSSSGRADFNPSTTAGLSLNITQPLLQGFGVALNSRGIRIAKNNIQVNDLVFRQQVIETVSAVVNLYWDLVSYNEDVRVKEQALKLARKLYEDNRKQVEIGTLAPIAIVQAEAEVAAREQELLVAQTNVLQQETILKNALSRTGVDSPLLAEAHIVTTDRIRVPEIEAVEPIQDLVARAMQSRPELGQSEIQLENARINLKATRNAMLPSLDAFMDLRNNALSGQINPLPVPSISGLAPQPRDPRLIDPFFLGGYGNALAQIFRRNFPDYAFGVQLNVPLRNRAAQADMISAQLSLRQSELRRQKQINQIRVEVQNALVAVQQARAGYHAATKNRILQEQNLDAEQKKYALGASTIFFVIQAQRDLAAAQGREVAALSSYARARAELDRATGQTLERNNVRIEEAFRGQVSRGPNPPPALGQEN